jgi:hypothetical protein
MKICQMCHPEKPEADFFAGPGEPLYPRCAECNTKLDEWRNQSPKERRQNALSIIGYFMQRGIYISASGDQLYFCEAGGSLTDEEFRMLQGLRWRLCEAIQHVTANGGTTRASK